jgi:two-component system, OmpR family, sensor histidine kinase QseC
MNGRSQERWSLKSRMTLMLFGLVMCLWILSAVVIYYKADHESQELFDSSLSETANLLLFLSEHEIHEVGSAKISGEDAIRDSSSPQYLAFQLWDMTGNLKYRSANAPETPLAPLATHGFSWQSTGDETRRTYNLKHTNGSLRIIVSEPLKHRQEIAGHFFGGLIAFSVVLLPFGYLGVRYLVSKALSPVDECAKQVNALDVRNLKPVNARDLPVEILPLVDGLNSAILRIQEGIEREKRFTADAAHELRTPLAGVRANVQLLQKQLQNPTEDQSDIMSDAMVGIDRCSRLINQLLALSKSDANIGRNSDPEKLDLAPIVQAVIQMESAHAKSKSVSIRLSESSAASMEIIQLRGKIQAYPTALELLLRNLVNNAIAYNKEGGQVEIAVDALPSPNNSNRLLLNICVKDDGPGIPLDKQAFVFERFFRLHPNQSKGSGLGLSICNELATLHSTSIEIADGLNDRGVGFKFTLQET